MSKHTPGPWVAIKGKGKRGWKIQAKGRLGGQGPLSAASVLWDVAITSGGAPSDPSGAIEANARLIAAAPELLEALKRLSAEEHRDDDDPVLMSAREQARAAIAKAEGK